MRGGQQGWSPGYHFWNNSEGGLPQVPRDAFWSWGVWGQFLIMVPSKELVIVRFGNEADENFDLNQFIPKVLTILPS